MAAVLAWVGETSLARGRPYVGRLLDQRRTGPELKARCAGSAAQPYRVTASHICTPPSGFVGARFGRQGLSSVL
jgi:hypothetical protein